MNGRASIPLVMTLMLSAGCVGGPIPAGSPAPLSGWGNAQIDGDLDADWANAGCASFTATSPVGDVPASACVMNDATNLYVLISYTGAFWDTIDNHAGLSLDETGSWTIDMGDDLWRHYVTPVWPGLLDDHWSSNSASTPDVNGGGVIDGQASFKHNGSQAFYELMHPLNTTTSHDISVSIGDTIGALFYLGVAGTTTTLPDYAALVPIIIANGPRPPPLCERLRNCQRVPMRPNLIELVCDLHPCTRVDELPRNCMLKFPCPICPGGGLCPPFHVEFDGLENDWDVELVDARGKRIRHRVVRTPTGVRLSFQPPARKGGGGMPDYAVVFRLKPDGDLNRTYRVGTRVESGAR